MTISQFDNSYEAKARAANRAAAQQRYFMTYRGEWQATRLAATNGLLYGGAYGAAAGLVSGIYSRQLSHVPKGALALGVPYAAVMSISTLYRMDM